MSHLLKFALIPFRLYFHFHIHFFSNLDLPTLKRRKVKVVRLKLIQLRSLFSSNNITLKNKKYNFRFGLVNTTISCKYVLHLRTFSGSAPLSSEWENAKITGATLEL